MGCFSFLCKVCGEPINSDSFKGENVRLSLLNKGKVVEEMQGQYDSYGRVFDENGESIEWDKPWDEVCDLMFDGGRSSGIHAAHAICLEFIPNYKPVERSDDDPDQGWGKLKKEYKGKCEIYHKIIE